MFLPATPDVVGQFSKVPTRMPGMGAPGVASSAVGEGGIPGTTAAIKGRLVLTPQEAATNSRMLDLAKKRAVERGHMFAGGMVPEEGRKVPRMPTMTETQESPGPKMTFDEETGEWKPMK
jgi:hypothetical protein